MGAACDRQKRVQRLKKIILGFIAGAVLVPFIFSIILGIRVVQLHNRVKELEALLEEAESNEGRSVYSVSAIEESPRDDENGKRTLAEDAGAVEENTVRKEIYLTFDDGPSRSTSLMCAIRFREHLAYHFEVSLNSVFFGFAMVVGVVMAAFIPLFFGTEYSDGAIRNKLIVGHSRVCVYFANLIASLGAAVAFSAAYLLACIAVGIPLIGGLNLPAAATAAALGGSLVMTAAYCAIFTFITMTCSKKSASAVACLLGVFLLLAAAITTLSMLDAP